METIGAQFTPSNHRQVAADRTLVFWPCGSVGGTTPTVTTLCCQLVTYLNTHYKLANKTADIERNDTEEDYGH